LGATPDNRLVDERWLKVDGTPLFTRSWGDPGGTPVLYWHGVSLTARASLTVSPAAPTLANRGLHVFAPDAPGFGSSPPLEREAYHPHALVDLVTQLLDALGLDTARFMGFSWGGDLGLHIAARHPERLTTLVILDAGYEDPPFDPTKSFEAYLEENEQFWEEACEPSWESALAGARERFHRWSPAIEETFRAAWREENGRLVPSGSPSVVAAVEHGMAQALPSTVKPAVAASGLPVLLVASEDASQADLVRFAADVPQAEIRRAEGANHDVLADGGPALVELVCDWLDATD
jgi:pimeloyl-ACP methyl ester carboxylesterase